MRLLRPRRGGLRASALAVTAGCLAVGLVGCGGDADDSGSVASCGTTLPSVTADEIKLGLIVEDTGPLASSMGAFRAGVDARLGVANAAGGVNGRQITYVWRDDEGERAVNKQVAAELVNGEQVFGIVEAPGPSSGSIEDLAKANIPVTGLGSDLAWSNQTNMFSWLYLGQGSTSAWGDYLAAAGGRRAGIFVNGGTRSNSDFTRQFLSSLLAPTHDPLTIVKQYPITGASTDIQALAQDIVNNKIDTLAGVLLPDVAAKLVPAVRAIAPGQLTVVLLPVGYDRSTLRKNGRSLAGVSVFIAIKAVDTRNPNPQQKAFLDAMQQYAPSVDPPTQDSAVDGWIAADLFLTGLEKAGACPTRETFISALRQVRDYDNAGMAPGTSDLTMNYKYVSPCYDIVRFNSQGTAFETVPDTAHNSQDHCGTLILPEQMDQLLAKAGL